MAETKSLDNQNRLATAQNMSEEEFLDAEKSLKRKLDLRLLGCVWVIFVMNYLDRNNIAAAKVSGIAESLNMSAQQYSTAVAILFVGYVLMQIPSNVFLASLRPSLYLPGCMAVWGLISTLTGITQSSGGLYACRFFLGFVEAAFYPGALFLISSWYKRSEMGLRSAVLFSATQLGSAFSGLIGAGIQYGLDGARGLEAWRWLFIIEGSITICIALFSAFVLPDWPSTTKWLTPTERAVAEWRLIRDAGQVDEDDEKWSYGFKLAFKDWRVYVFAAMFFCLQVAAATSNFFPSVVQTLGYGRVTTLLLTAPPYMLGLIFSIVNNWSADRLNNSSFHVMWPLALAIVGFVTAAATLNTGARYLAMMLMVGGGHGANAVVLAWAQKTMLRPRIKRAAAVAFINAFGNISQVWTAYLYTDASKPRYVLAMTVNSGFALGVIILAMTMRIILQRANKKLDSGADVADIMKGEAQAQIEGLSEEDRAARRAAFRYTT
ncbi:major facilitator superfamily domain-containing protein [Ilyonectria sp. MPI-CAGE-AT-0026]|nr:major facilitator superfamily domain-containing protein [Ilyonectria sp. MPI-CAGE-AT-0026]